VGLSVGIGLFYNENWYGYHRKHLEWGTALRDWNEGGDSSLRQCLYYFSPVDKSHATLKSLFCIRIKENNNL